MNSSIKAVNIVKYSIRAQWSVTRGRGERSCATCRLATKGTVRRLGRTRKEAIASIIIVSDMALKMNARGSYRGWNTNKVHFKYLTA